MKSLQITIKNLKELFRNLKSNAILFVLPIAFIAIFGLAFNKSNDDIVFEVAYVKSSDQTYDTFIQNIKDIKNGKDKKIFSFKEYKDFDSAKKAVQDNKYLGLVEWDTTKQQVIFSGDTSNAYFNAAAGVINNFSTQFFQLPEQKVITKSLDLPVGKDVSPFDLLVPGLIVYAILLLIIQTAVNFSEIKEKNQIFRYFTSKTKSFDIILGYLLSMIVIALIQASLLFGVSALFGFELTLQKLLFGLAIAIPTCVFSVGIGLIIGAYVGKPEPAGNTGSLVSLVLGFFSGSFIVGIENVVTFGEINGRTLRLTDFVPSFHATQAMRSVLLYGKSISDVSLELGILIGFSIIFLIIGVVVFHNKQLKRVQ